MERLREGTLVDGYGVPIPDNSVITRIVRDNDHVQVPDRRVDEFGNRIGLGNDESVPNHYDLHFEVPNRHGGMSPRRIRIYGDGTGILQGDPFDNELEDFLNSGGRKGLPPSAFEFAAGAELLRKGYKGLLLDVFPKRKNMPSPLLDVYPRNSLLNDKRFKPLGFPGSILKRDLEILNVDLRIKRALRLPPFPSSKEVGGVLLYDKLRKNDWSPRRFLLKTKKGLQILPSISNIKPSFRREIIIGGATGAATAAAYYSGLFHKIATIINPRVFVPTFIYRPMFEPMKYFRDGVPDGGGNFIG